MSVGEPIDFVEVQYNYTYDDDDGENVDIKVGDRYLLLERTNDEWWHVQRPGGGDSFFVPAQYVLVVAHPDIPVPERETVENVDSSAVTEQGAGVLIGEGGVRGAGQNCVASNKSSTPSPTPIAAEDSPEQIYANTESIRKPAPKKFAPPSDVEYANLNDYRIASNIPQPKPKINVDQVQGDPAGEYANLAIVPGGGQPPPVSDGEYVRRLLDGLPWLVYKEPLTGRLYYFNEETKERSWKPPRKERAHNSPTEAKDIALPSPRDPGPAIVTSGVPPPKVHFQDPNNIPKEYDKVEDNGQVCYVNRYTQDKWQTSADQSGKVYYYRMDSGETSWELPQSEMDQNDNKENRTQYPGSHNSLSRLGKSRSMYGGRPSDKASTLPANFSPSRTAPPPPSTPPFSGPGSGGPPRLQQSQSALSFSQMQSEIVNDVLNRTKVMESGKKVKKSWAQSYVVLSGSNLVMYKDQKASAAKPGSPHGKTELVISMLGAKIDSNPKDFSSRKNTILVSNQASGTQVLLQHDDEKIYQKWLFRLKVAADDIPKGEEEDRGFTLTRQGSTMRGSVGDDGTNRSVKGIRNRLVNLITRRPPQEELVKRGIIKDAVFGSLLTELCHREHTSVPRFVKECIAAVERRGLDHDGLYRISGNLAEVQRLRYAVDKEESYNLDDRQWDVHVLTGALKLFFRELKDSLFPSEMFDKFTKAIQQNSHRAKTMRELVKSLHASHRDTMKVLFEHLLKVIEMSDQNRMQIHNIAIVFGPTLMWSEAGDGMTLAAMTVYQSKVVEQVLSHYNDIFK